MISIKVCRLSDLINKVIYIFVTIIFLVILFNVAMQSIEKFSTQFIKFAIDNKLGIKTSNNLIEEMLMCNLPINLYNSQDDIEKEFNLADNIIGSKGFNVTKEGNDINGNVELNNSSVLEKNNGSNSTKGNELIDLSKITLSTPYLLDCEKISDSKYKIGSTTINNYTKKNLEIDELEKSLFTKVDKDCKVLIYHTHTSESYSGIEKYTDVYRTEDNECNVVKVGETLKEELSKYGIYVRHDKTIHDSPSYNGAYKSSLDTVNNILEKENYDIIIDIHRDALASNSQYRPTAEINGETVAKLMLVVGTNAAGLIHDKWIENLKFALLLQERGNEIFPGLFRDMHLSTSRYNQHTSDKTIILEVGATGNTIDEACSSMKYFAKLINSIKENDK